MGVAAGDENAIGRDGACVANATTYALSEIAGDADDIEGADSGAVGVVCEHDGASLQRMEHGVGGRSAQVPLRHEARFGREVDDGGACLHEVEGRGGGRIKLLSY